MNSLYLKLLGSLTLALVFSPAHAVTTFYFTDGAFNAHDLSVHYSASGSDIELDVTASTTNSQGTSASWVGQYGYYGLGVSSGAYDSLKIDGSNGVERLNLSFSQDVKFVSAKVRFYGDDDSFSFNVYDDTNNSNIGVSDMLGTFDTVQGWGWGSETSYLGDYTFASELSLGKSFGIGANNSFVGAGYHGSHSSFYDNNTRFKLLSINVEAINLSNVPVPAALPLFGTGLAIMGLVGWRRRRKQA